MLFCCLWIFVFKLNFSKNLSGIPSECLTVWIQIRPDILSGLIWVQTVCKGYQQMTKVATRGERVKASSGIPLRPFLKWEEINWYTVWIGRHILTEGSKKSNLKREVSIKKIIYIMKVFLYIYILINYYRIRSNYCTYPYKRTVKKFRSLQITANVLFLYFFIKAYVVGTHLNCIDLSMQFKWVLTTYAFGVGAHLNCINLSMQFKWVLTTYAFIKKIRKKSYYNHQINPILIFYSVPLVGRFIFYHNWVFPVILKNLSAQCGN